MTYHTKSTCATVRPKKPLFGEPCNGCGYCCTTQPCQLAADFLNCHAGPCVALEHKDGRTFCGFVRNPLGYLYSTVSPTSAPSPLENAFDCEHGRALSAELASALGVGKGCDSDDNEHSAEWQ